MSRLFSVPRRRPNLVDLLIPNSNAAGTRSYLVYADANFDSTFMAPIITSTCMGYLDPVVDQSKLNSQPGNNVRIVFDPATYGLPDDAYIWLKVALKDGAGVQTDISPPTLMLPDSAHHGVGVITLHGSAPSGNDVGDSLQIDFGMLMTEVRIHNEDGVGGKSLYIASEPGGAEQECPPDPAVQYVELYGTQPGILIRGAGAKVNFSLTATVAFPK